MAQSLVLRRSTPLGKASAARGDTRRAEEKAMRRKAHVEWKSMKRLALEIRLAKARERAVKAERNAVSAEAKKRRVELETQKREAIEMEKRLRAHERHWAQHAAAEFFVQLQRNLLQDGRRQKLATLARRAALEPEQQKRATRTLRAPHFWRAEVGDLFDLTVRRQGDNKAVPLTQRVYCSNNFQWHLFGRRLQEHSKNPCPRRALQLLVDHSMPEYSALMGRRYAVLDVLKANHNVVDLAFMEMQWRYAEFFGRDAHPMGLHEWPPRDARGSECVSTAGAARSSRG